MGLIWTKYIDALKETTMAAKKSTDPSTQNAASLCDDAGKIVVGPVCNRFSRGVRELDSRWERPEKYEWVEHSERAVIHEAARLGIKTDGIVMVCPFFACAPCSRAIVDAGIKAVVGIEINKKNTHSRWDETCRIGDVIRHEGKVESIRVAPFLGIQLLRNGKLITI